jgi:hypothetical protein
MWYFYLRVAFLRGVIVTCPTLCVKRHCDVRCVAYHYNGYMLVSTFVLGLELILHVTIIQLVFCTSSHVLHCVRGNVGWPLSVRNIRGFHKPQIFSYGIKGEKQVKFMECPLLFGPDKFALQYVVKKTQSLKFCLFFYVGVKLGPLHGGKTYFL